MPDYVVRYTLEIITFFIILFLLRPLWKLTSTRSALIIVFSRAVGNMLRLLLELPNFINLYILKTANPLPQPYYFINNANYRTFNAMQAFHILALAINRVHAIFFPFHYQRFAAKRK